MQLIEIGETGEFPEEIPMGAFLQEVIAGTVSHYQRTGFQRPWISYVGVENEVPVGVCGFKGEPVGGRVEIAYGTSPGHRGKESLVDGLDQFAREAYAVIRSPQAREAFDTNREPERVAGEFGESRFGQSCLLAMRLIEAGVRCSTVTFSGWDTHSGNFKKKKVFASFGSGAVRTLHQLGETRSIGIDGGVSDGRVWPHTEDQLQSRSRSLASRVLRIDGRRRCSRRANSRSQR